MTSTSCSGVARCNQNKENAELRRHVKRRTQALDTIRRSYIIDVERLKRGVRDQVRVEVATTVLICSISRPLHSPRKYVDRQAPTAQGEESREICLCILCHQPTASNRSKRADYLFFYDKRWSMCSDNGSRRKLNQLQNSRTWMRPL